ncbi:hypothetical protein CJ030_MR5G004145 [Morella rubra]|uniref:RING-type domain-containing protein n=1 Tax=Morella rubra TaxID=262757 RepID=A0A6A1VHE3_9ROSI|nr:hypothetical protein CJ030_MR5G004145 [Morella rubra]
MENGNLYHVKIDQEANQDQVPEQGNSHSEEVDNTRPRCLGGAGNFQSPGLDDMPEQAIGHPRDAANRCPDHEPHSSEVGQHNNEAVETFQIETSSADSPIFLEDGCTIDENNQTAAGPTPEYLYAEETEDLTSPVQESQNQSRSSSHQVLEEEVRKQPSPTPSEIEMPPYKNPSDKQLSSEDDLSSFNDPISKPFRQNCLLCGGDLAFSPERGNGFGLTISEVAVLSCGHVFHCLCLEHITSDKSKDPPCFICFNGLDE